MKVSLHCDVFHVSSLLSSTSTLPKTSRRDSTVPSRCWLERVTAPQRTSGALPAWWDTLSASDTSTHTLCHGLGRHWGHVPNTSHIFALHSLHFLQPSQPLNSLLTYWNVSFWATSKRIGVGGAKPAMERHWLVSSETHFVCSANQSRGKK